MMWECRSWKCQKWVNDGSCTAARWSPDGDCILLAFDNQTRIFPLTIKKEPPCIETEIDLSVSLDTSARKYATADDHFQQYVQYLNHKSFVLTPQISRWYSEGNCMGPDRGTNCSLICRKCEPCRALFCFRGNKFRHFASVGGDVLALTNFL